MGTTIVSHEKLLAAGADMVDNETMKEPILSEPTWLHSASTSERTIISAEEEEKPKEQPPSAMSWIFSSSCSSASSHDRTIRSTEEKESREPSHTSADDNKYTVDTETDVEEVVEE